MEPGSAPGAPALIASESEDIDRFSSSTHHDGNFEPSQRESLFELDDEAPAADEETKAEVTPATTAPSATLLGDVPRRKSRAASRAIPFVHTHVVSKNGVTDQTLSTYSEGGSRPSHLQKLFDGQNSSAPTEKVATPSNSSRKCAIAACIMFLMASFFIILSVLVESSATVRPTIASPPPQGGLMPIGGGAAGGMMPRVFTVPKYCQPLAQGYRRLR